jgi:hypothetical protein
VKLFAFEHARAGKGWTGRPYGQGEVMLQHWGREGCAAAHELDVLLEVALVTFGIASLVAQAAVALRL